MDLVDSGLVLGETIGGPVLGVTVMVTGVFGKKVKTGIIGKIKMEVVTGMIVWMEKTAGKMTVMVMMMMMVKNVGLLMMMVITKYVNTVGKITAYYVFTLTWVTGVMMMKMIGAVFVGMMVMIL